MVDLSLLDQVNDTLGHARGEVFVRLATERLARRAAAQPGRTGPASPPASRATRSPSTSRASTATTRTARARSCASASSRPTSSRACASSRRWWSASPPTARGSADVPAGPERTAALLRRADVALAATRDGVEAVRCYEPSMGERAARRLRLIRGFSGGRRAPGRPGRLPARRLARRADGRSGSRPSPAGTTPSWACCCPTSSSPSSRPPARSPSSRRSCSTSPSPRPDGGSTAGCGCPWR